MDEPHVVLEARYINVNWADKISAISLKTANEALPVLKVDLRQYDIDVTTFSKVDLRNFGQVAFKVLDSSIKAPLFILKPNGKKTDLIPVKDNETGSIWWVEGEKWSKSNKRWQSEIFRSAGLAIVGAADYRFNIKISSCSFTYEQLSSYLQDFKSDLWSLVLNENSYVTGSPKDKTHKILDENSAVIFNHYCSFVEKILEKPKFELRESQELKEIKKVRPTPKTFMEIATTGYKKKLTSRSSYSTYNTPENQYILFIVNRVFNLLKNINTVTGYVTSTLENRKILQETRLSSFVNKVKINRDAVVFDYEDLRKKLKKEELKIEEVLESQNKKNYNNNDLFSSYTLTLAKKLEHSHDLSFFLKAGFEKPDKGYYKITFNEEFESILEEYQTYEIKSFFSYHIYQKNDKEVHHIKFEYIEAIKVINSKTEQKLYSIGNQAKVLSNNNWERLLTTSERKEQDQEKREVELSIKVISEKINSNLNVSDKFKPVIKKLLAVQKKMVRLNIVENNLFPNSMSFVQNPYYQGAHKLYKEIMALSGIDETIFSGLEEADKIGILNISLIYERWCFLQIIKVLTEKYRFEPEANWKNKLLNQVINVPTDKVRNVSLFFTNKALSKSVLLWYEKELPIEKGKKVAKRADFVLDIIDGVDSGGEVLRRIVYDAKFYENIDKMSGISGVINELYNTKNYSNSENDQVFILHPSKGAVKKLKTPQTWSKDSFFGETKQFEWDDSFPNHRYGAIYLSPINNKGSYLDTLQMCIGMFLEYGIGKRLDDITYNEWIQAQSYITKTSGINPLPAEKLFCLVCGSNSCSLSVSETFYKLGLKWTLNCEDCGHQALYNYCISKACRHRLIKHGSYWTYHATQSLEPYNIKCPSCGEITVGPDK